MASCSNSSLALVTSSRRNYYDVFVTFRGEDTRNNFIDFLFDAFETKGIFASRDDTNLKKGESIGPELLRAIERSKVFVVVFSRNYASSTWCLQELEKICECVKGSRKHVLPVFYDVDPSEVRKQTEIYCGAFVKHEQGFQQDPQKVSRWREALKQVGSISGWDLRDKPQCAEIKKIVQNVMNILDCKPSCNSKDLVGINSRIQALQNHLLLDSVDGVRAIGIWGMGGIGKTTLALDLYGQISHRFDASCFIDDVSKIYRLHDGPLEAQKQIIFQTLGIEHYQICNRYSATYLIRRRLCHERALLILDNVDQVEQLEKLDVHREWLGAGSRIVIISRDEHILKKYGVDVVYKVPLLNWIDSYRLICRKAFKVEKTIMSNYHNLVYEILDYAKGLPLAITILGSFLFGRNVNEWKSALARLRESPDNDVMDVLQLSFDGLNRTEKEIFLDIACFFDHGYKKYVKNILNCCGFHADIGLRVLIDKSLISIIKSPISIHDSMISMHSFLKDLGRKIVQENSSTEQRKWSRIWSKKQLYNVTIEKMENHVEAIVLKYEDDEDLDIEHLSKMSNLRLLIINTIVNISGSPCSLSKELRYIEWRKYPLKYLPSSFHPNELVELILKESKIKQLWRNKKYLPNLRTLDLSNSREVEQIIDFGEFPNLEQLNLKGCINLVELDQSIGLLSKLVYLNLKNCKNLVSIPNNIFGLCSLEYLNMWNCYKAFTNRSNSKKHDIRESASHSQSTSTVFKGSLLLHNSTFPALTTNAYLFPPLRSLYCLRNVDISFCHLSQVPYAIECLHWLERLNLGGNYFVTLPSLRKLSKLVYLNLEHCRFLESLPQLPFPTTIGRDHPENNSGRYTGLFIFNCPKLAERELYSSMAFSWMTQFIKANLQSYPAYFEGIHIVTPGSKIPSWINNQSMGDSIAIDEYPIMRDKNNNIIGFVCCAVFSVAPYRGRNMRMVFYPINLHIPVTIKGSLITTKSSHIWIIYFPKESYHIFGKINFEIIDGEGLGMEVKSCGYHWVCKEDIQEFNLTMMNQENSLVPKCKILEIEDETQPQPQPEQETFISQGTETEVSVEVPDSPVAYEVSTESPSAEVRTSEDSSLKSDANTGKRNDAPHNSEKSGPGRRDSSKSGSRKFIGRFLNNCFQ